MVGRDRSDRQVGGDVGLVGRFIAGKARVALDAEEVRRDVVEAGEGVGQALLELGHEQLEGPFPQSLELGLVGFEPGTRLFGLELEEEVDAAVRESVEAFGRDRHLAPSVRPYELRLEAMKRVLPLVLAELLLASACRGGARGAAPLPMPTEPAQWLAVGLFVFGIWWVAMKITRG